jgi:hypothetical protein
MLLVLTVKEGLGKVPGYPELWVSIIDAETE